MQNHCESQDIHENALTCDYIEKAHPGYHYTNTNGSIYKIVYYTRANEWGDAEHVIFGKTIQSVLKKYDKLTHRLHDYDDELEMTTEDLAYMVNDYCVVSD